MTWAKFDDKWATHPKLLAAGLEAKGLDASGICYSAGQETDGFVPDVALVILAAGHRNPRKVADRLIEVGRWIRDDERKGYVIHDFDRYNFTRAQGEAKRTKDAERKASARSKQGRGANGRITSGQTDEDVRSDTDDCPPGFHEESARTPTLVPPVPTRPDPTPTQHQSSSSNTVAGDEPAEEEEPLGRLEQTVRLVAQRRLDRRLTKPELEPITDRTAWLARTVDRELQRIAADPGFAANMVLLVADPKLSVAQLADLIDPPERPPATVNREQLPPAWDLDEHGLAVPAVGP